MSHSVVYNDYEKILDALSDPIHIIDATEYVVFVNTAWEKMMGKTRAEVLGRHINDVIADSMKGFYLSIERNPDTQETKFLHFNKKLLQSVALIALKEQRERSMMTYDDNRRLVLNSTPITEDGKVRYVLTTVHDLTSMSALYDDLDTALQDNRLLTSELEFYKGIITSKSFIGESPAIKTLLKTVEYVAPTDATILITGESGVGKEVLTNEIYRLSKRKGSPFIRVNCASIPESLIESELFGYERGAFTGAVKSKPGMFELANKGTLLLDEIGELPKSMQPKLLRALQEHEIMRVGGSNSIPVDVRLIAATNQNLEKMVQKGEFRRDLYYRLNLIPLHIPPLRERREDLAPLISHFLDKYNTKYNKEKRVTDAAMQVMRDYTWPGNIRELQNLLERLVIIGEEARITSAQVLKIIGAADESEYSIQIDEEEGISLKEAVARYEKELLQKALTQYGTTYKAAQALRASQATIARKAKDYGLEW